VPERRSTRFAFEVLFLVALAAGLTVADLDALRVVGGMFLGWVLVALFEWASIRREPHYGRGLPPRYYVPRVSLPPSLPLDRDAAGFPLSDARGDGDPWLAPPADGWGWPEPEPAADGEGTEVSEAVEAVTSVAPAVEVEAAAMPERAESAVEAGPTEVGLASESAPGEQREPESERAAVPEPARATLAVPVPAEAPAAESEPPVATEPTRPAPDHPDSHQSARGTSRHRIDPLVPASGRRRRRREEAGAVIEVSARPTARVLPGTSRRDQQP
jgi:hypothetical protein